MLIGIHGKKRSGKDTMADYIVEKWFNKKVARFAFANPLKKGVSELFGIPMQTIEDEKETPLPNWDNKTPRYLLQTVGDQARSLFPDVFIRTMQTKIDENQDTNCIITDVRFNDEAQFILDNNGMVFTVDANERLGDNNKDNHISEQAIDPSLSDYTIYNNGELSQFYAEIDIIMANLFY